jgi:hypothetical protein
MRILNNILNGATSQFGREIGRSAANNILKGSNGYNINTRIKPSDSEIVRTIKEMKKVSFVKDKTINISRLVEITDKIIPFCKFNGLETLVCHNEFKILLELYNTKYEHGCVLIGEIESDEYNFLMSKRNQFEKLIDKYNIDFNAFVIENRTKTSKNRKLKKDIIKDRIVWIFIFLLTLIFSSIINKFVFSSGWFAFLSILSFFCIITQSIRILYISLNSQQKIDARYNSDYLFFDKF